MTDAAFTPQKNTIQAVYYDGKNATAYPVAIKVSAPDLTFSLLASTDGLNARIHTYPIQDCTLDAPLGQGPRNIQLPDGGLIEIATTPEHRAYLLHQWPQAQGWQPRLHSAAQSSLHWMETHWSTVCIALIGISLSLLWAIKVGIPQVSERLAANLPPAVERRLGEHILNTLNQPALGYFADSQVPASQQQAIHRSLLNFCQQNDCPPHLLLFKASQALGANAIAIPGGTLIVTDGLVNLASSPTEVVAILAHEMAHLKHQHGLRQVLQTSLSGLVLLVLTGDVSSIAAGLPTLLVNMQYSRAFEAEADSDALMQLRKACIPPRLFADMLARLVAKQSGDAPVPELLASHPDTLKRMQPFLKTAPTCHS